MDFSELSSKPSAEPGRFGKYYLQELINSGGMADIWVATNQDHKTFALRRLHKNLRFNFTARKRFFQGCEILSKIHNHEFVIGYVDHGTIELTPYLLMEYVEASNLKLLLGRQDPILAENLAQIIIDSALALEHVHDSGFMHLDYKPENILVTRSGGVRLVDFDLAQPKPEEPIKMSKNPGTPAYMAPEQLQRQPFDARADIFSFGVTAYELLAGQKPFSGDTPEEILRAELNDVPASPRELNPDIPAGLEKTILKCLKPTPAERYPYMSIVVRDLQTALYI
jgi:eukaryotic-like serine/threonine-protein kinase